MTVTGQAPAAESAEAVESAEALIKEARHRQRRRRRTIAAVLVAVAATVVGVVVGTGGSSPPPARNPGNGTLDGQVGVLAGSATTVLMWPAGPAVFGDLPGGGSGTTSYLDDLGAGKVTIRRITGIAGGDFPYSVVPVGDQLVYNGPAGVSAIDDTLTGPPRLLGAATEFVPAAQPGAVWLVRISASSGLVTRLQLASVASGHVGLAIAVPPRTGAVIEGTTAGLLLMSAAGNLELWHPGVPPRVVATLPGGYGDGVAADSRMIAYGTRCRSETATSGFASTPVGYDACGRLQVLDLLAGRSASFPPPPGTLGWQPGGFGGGAFSPGDTMLAAGALTAPARNGRDRLFVLRLSHGSAAPEAVPSSRTPLYSRTVWSIRGSWLLYGGSAGRLRAFQIGTGRTESFSQPCCRYTAMVGIPNRSH